MINIGKYIEMAINWLTENFTLFFDAINVGIGGFIDGFQNLSSTYKCNFLGADNKQ